MTLAAEYRKTATGGDAVLLRLAGMALARIYREVDGERIDGTSRPVFIRNGRNYYLTDLRVYADGSIWCWEWVDLDGLREKLRTGWVATRLQAGEQASAHDLAMWRFAEPQMVITAECLLGEVADDIDTLNGRPDSSARCIQAAERYVQTRAEDDRLALRAAYQAIPEHHRVYALGDMDRKDWPLRVLCTDLGAPLDWPGEHVVTGEMRQRALAYFAERERAITKSREHRDPDGPGGADSPTVHLNQAVFPEGWPADPGRLVLLNNYPAPMTIGGSTYPTLAHAYWGLAVTDPAVSEQIQQAPQPFRAQKLAEQAQLREDWPMARTAVMAGLLRAKFTQHPEFADVLLATGDARILYLSFDSPHWTRRGSEGRNWIGRLLELVRAELAATRAGIPVP